MAETALKNHAAGAPAGTNPLRLQSVAAARAARTGAEAGERQHRREFAELSHTLREVQAELVQLRAKTDEVDVSVQFTEAYLSIGLAERMAEVLRTEVAAADRWRNAQLVQGRRTRRARLTAFVLGAMLLMELQTGWMRPSYEQAGVRAAEALSLGVNVMREKLG